MANTTTYENYKKSLELIREIESLENFSLDDLIGLYKDCAKSIRFYNKSRACIFLETLLTSEAVKPDQFLETFQKVFPGRSKELL